MCGIFGVVNGTKSRSARLAVCNFAKDAFVAGSLRGEDSTGMMQRHKGTTSYHKMPVAGPMYNKDTITKGLINDVDVSLFTVGHNRAATHGVVSKDNAHPFTHYDKVKGSLTGVHNGTLQDWQDIDSSKGILVDSDWAMKMLHTEGMDAFEYFKGAFCFVWYDDTSPDVLRFARNTERPMYFAYEKGKDTMLFASEAGMLSWLCERNKIDIEDTIYELDKDHMYQFNLSNPREFTKLKLPAVNDKHFKWKAKTNKKSSKWVNDWDYEDYNGYGQTSGTSEERFLARLTSAISVGLSTVKKTSKEVAVEVLDPFQESLLDLEEVSSEEEESKEAETWNIKGSMVTVYPYRYNEVTKVVSWEISDTDNMSADAAGLLNDIAYIRSRGVEPTTYADLKRINRQKVRIVGAYYDDMAPNDLSVIVTNERMDAAKLLNKMTA